MCLANEILWALIFIVNLLRLVNARICHNLGNIHLVNVYRNVIDNLLANVIERLNDELSDNLELSSNEIKGIALRMTSIWIIWRMDSSISTYREPDA